MTYLVSAYIAIWVILFIYLFTLSSRQKSLKKEVARLLNESKMESGK
jgi:CcmD family protein